MYVKLLIYQGVIPLYGVGKLSILQYYIKVILLSYMLYCLIDYIIYCFYILTVLSKMIANCFYSEYSPKHYINIAIYIVIHIIICIAILLYYLLDLFIIIL